MGKSNRKQRPDQYCQRAGLLDRANEPPPEDVAARLAERDARYDADTRTEAERWLNDPPPGRSALTPRRVVKSTTAARVLTTIIETRGQ